MPLELAGRSDAFEAARAGLEAVGLGASAAALPGAAFGRRAAARRHRPRLRRRRPSCCSPTSRPEISTARPGASSWICCSACAPSAAPRCSSSPTIRELARRCDRIVALADGRVAARRSGDARARARLDAMPLAWRLARRELRGGLRGFRIFFGCLALGVAVIAGGGLARRRDRAGPHRRCARALGRRCRIHPRPPHRPTPAERALSRARKATVSHVTQLRAMARTQDGDAPQPHRVQGGRPRLSALRRGRPRAGAAARRRRSPSATGIGARWWRRRSSTGSASSSAISSASATRDFAVRAALVHEPDGISGLIEIGPRVMIAARLRSPRPDCSRRASLINHSLSRAARARRRRSRGGGGRARRAFPMPAGASANSAMPRPICSSCSTG